MTPTIFTGLCALLWMITGGMIDAGASVGNTIGIAACGLGCIVVALLIWRGEDSNGKKHF